MENTSQNTTPSALSFLDFVGFVFFYIILNWVNESQYLLSKFTSFFPSKNQSILAETNSNAKATKKNALASQQLRSNDDDSDGVPLILSREDMELVLGKMGIMSCSPDDENRTTADRLGGSEFSSLFEENEPSIEEVKEAFDVFDANRDGFIDAKELQRVLCSLGYREAMKLEACERMIVVSDKKGKNRIDFIEFVKLMENSFE